MSVYTIVLVVVVLGFCNAYALNCVSCATSIKFNGKSVSAAKYNTDCNDDKKAKGMTTMEMYCEEGMCASIRVSKGNKVQFVHRSCFTHVTHISYNTTSKQPPLPPNGCVVMNGLKATYGKIDVVTCFCSDPDYCNSNSVKSSRKKRGEQEKLEQNELLMARTAAALAHYEL